MNKALIRLKKGVTALLICTIAFALGACNRTDGGDSLGDTLSSFSYEAGNWDGNIYSSNFLGFKVTMPDNWTAASEEEISTEKENIINDSLASSDASREEIERGIIYEFKLTNDATYSYVNVVLKDMDIVYSMAYSEEDFMNVYRQNMQQMNVGDMRISAMSDPQWVNLAGNKYYMSEMEYSYNNTTTYQRIYLRKIGTFMENLTMSVVDKEEFKEIESMFSPMDTTNN